MKKTIMITAIALTASLFFTACGSSNPDEIAKDFVSALTEANIKEAKSLSSENLDRAFKSINRECNKDREATARNLSQAFMKKMDEMKEGETGGDYNPHNILKKGKEETAKLKKAEDAKTTELKKEYGSIGEIPKELKEKFDEKRVSDRLAIFQKIILNELKLTDAEKDPVGVEVLAQMMVDNDLNRDISSLEYAVEAVFKRSPVKATEECVNNATKYGFIESINILETKKISPDKSKVRLELISKDDKSKKVQLTVEKIKGEWKVSSF